MPVPLALLGTDSKIFLSGTAATELLSQVNAVLQVPLSRLEMHPAPAPSCACSPSAFPEVY